MVDDSGFSGVGTIFTKVPLYLGFKPQGTFELFLL